MPTKHKRALVRIVECNEESSSNRRTIIFCTNTSYSVNRGSFRATITTRISVVIMCCNWGKNRKIC